MGIIFFVAHLNLAHRSGDCRLIPEHLRSFEWDSWDFTCGPHKKCSTFSPGFSLRVAMARFLPSWESVFWGSVPHQLIATLLANMGVPVNMAPKVRGVNWWSSSSEAVGWRLVRVKSWNLWIFFKGNLNYTSGNKLIAGWKMDPKWRCNAFLIEDVDIPAIAMWSFHRAGYTSGNISWI